MLLWRGDEDDVPEKETQAKYGTKHGFLTWAAATAETSNCPPNTHWVIAVKFGRWKTGSVPTQKPGGLPGEVDVDSIIAFSAPGTYDYLTYMQDNGKWLNMNHGYGVGTGPSKLREFDAVPTPGGANPMHGPLYIKFCVPN
jgi:hypothetical protein